MNPIIVVIPSPILFALALAPYVLLGLRALRRRRPRHIPTWHGLHHDL